MNFLKSSRFIKHAFLLPVIILMAGNFFCASSLGAEADNPFNETIRILERWTSAHWGQDCYVWVVHYPEEITDAWADAEAMRSGLSDSQRDEFKKNFIEDLNLDTSETFLISVYSFGARPVNLSPVKEKISLLASTGERVSPVKFDSSLENPSAGIVQGLVFFPKQSDKDYLISLKGMSSEERIFSFAPAEAPAPAQNKKENKREVIVLNLPKKETAKKTEPEKITPPPPPAIPPKPIKPLFQDTQESQSMEDFVQSIRAGKKASTESKDKAPEKITAAQPQRLSNTGSAYSSREAVLRKFLSLWVDGASLEMYEMLSEDSQKIISLENFTKHIKKSSDFRAGLKKGDYRIDWLGEERAKVIMTKRTLFIKSLMTRTLGVTREGSSWKIVWY